jgi:hypothetical protein
LVDASLVAGGRWPAAIAAGLIMENLFQSRCDVSGHAAEHLTGASVPVMAAAM